MASFSNEQLGTQLSALGKIIDSKDANKFASVFTADGSFIFGNQDAVVGPEAISAYCAYFFARIKSSTHTLVAVHQEGNTITWQGICTYVKHDGTVLPCPFCNIVTMNEMNIEANNPQVKKYQIYIDNHALFV